MSWSYGAVHEKGLILRDTDFKDLIKLNKKYMEENGLENEDIDDMFDGDLQNYAYDFGIYPVWVTIVDINKLVGFNESGEAQYDLEETIEDEIIYVMWLKKDNLLNSYSGYDEIYKEIEDNICEKFEVNINKIYEIFGKNFIEDRLGLASGFYSDR